VHDLPYPELVFDIGYFAKNPKPFYEVAKQLWPSLYKPNAAHYFARILQDENLLLRMYTQNIDGLERGNWMNKGGNEEYFVSSGRCRAFSRSARQLCNGVVFGVW